MWIPRSAPFASASLIVCFTRSGPIESATTSPPCFSFSRSASSSAKLSGSFISKPMSDSLIQFPAIASGASFAGTCLMHTMMFTGLSFSDSKNYLRRAQKGMLLAGPTLENQRGVGAAKAKRIRQRELDRRFARVIRHIIQIALGIGSFQIDGGRQNLVTQRQYADACLQTAGASEQMS